MNHFSFENEKDRLFDLLQANQIIQVLFRRIPELQLPHWYLAAGCISQTIWNLRAGYPADAGIKDYDLVYFDEELSYEAEDRFIQAGSELFADLPVAVEIRNQARVHLWYPERLGYGIAPFTSVEAAIASWPATITCLGVRYADRAPQLCAPWGLQDLWAGVVRPNLVLPSRDVYQAKGQRWKARWPFLEVIDWAE